MAFATTTDVATRLQRTLTSAQEDAVEAVLDEASAVIADVIGRDEADIENSAILRGVATSIAIRVVMNPQMLVSESETLGSYSRSSRYGGGDGAGGVELTATERAIVRRSVFGSNLTSPKSPPPIEEDTDYYLNGS